MKRALALAALLVASTASAAAPARISFLYDLSTVNGRISATGAGLAFDPRANEVLVIEGGLVRVFNQAGMEVHTFGDDDALRGLVAVAALEDGYLVLLSTEAGPRVVRCDFRGPPIAPIALRDVPAELAADFRPGTIAVVDGLVYLGDERRALVVVADLEGAFVRATDLAAVVGTGDEKGYAEASVRGLRIDARGTILFTVPTLFRAFAVTADGTARSFGTKGSTPGKFNVVVAVASDDAGNFYAVDVLRCSVSVFDADLRFVQQFGYRGRDPGALATPTAIVVGNGKVYVSQGLKEGVSVFTPLQG